MSCIPKAQYTYFDYADSGKLWKDGDPRLDPSTCNICLQPVEDHKVLCKHCHKPKEHDKHAEEPEVDEDGFRTNRGCHSGYAAALHCPNPHNEHFPFEVHDDKCDCCGKELMRKHRDAGIPHSTPTQEEYESFRSRDPDHNWIKKYHLWNVDCKAALKYSSDEYLSRDLLDRVLYPEDYVIPEPELLAPIAPYDIYDHYIIARRLAGATLRTISLGLATDCRHNISYQAVQHRITKMVRFESEVLEYLTKTSG